MDAAEFTAIRTQLNLTHRQLADILGLAEISCKKWGQNGVAHGVTQILLRLMGDGTVSADDVSRARQSPSESVSDEPAQSPPSPARSPEDDDAPAALQDVLENASPRAVIRAMGKILDEAELEEDIQPSLSGAEIERVLSSDEIKRALEIMQAAQARSVHVSKPTPPSIPEIIPSKPIASENSVIASDIDLPPNGDADLQYAAELGYDSDPADAYHVPAAPQFGLTALLDDEPDAGNSVQDDADANESDAPGDAGAANAADDEEILNETDASEDINAANAAEPFFDKHVREVEGGHWSTGDGRIWRTRQDAIKAYQRSLGQ